jgi:hypothetical protein
MPKREKPFSGGKGVLADSAPRNHGCDTVEKLKAWPGSF